MPAEVPPLAAPVGADPEPVERVAYRWRWLVLAAMLTAEIMDLLDTTVVNVAGPSLQDDLGAGPTALKWVIGGYPLAIGVGLVLGGRLGDRYGRRPLFMIGIVGFTAASLACALAPHIGLLIAFRLLQGLFGAVLLPQGIGLLRDAFPPQDLGRAFAVFGPAFGLAGIFGPLIGGGLIQADIAGLGWRSVFLVNIPLGIAVIAIAAKTMPASNPDPTIRIDSVGAVIVAVSAALIVLPLIQGEALGWPVWIWVSLALGVVGLVGFALQQRRRTSRGQVPLVTPTLFAKRAYLVGLIGIAVFFAVMLGVQLTLTLYLQLGQGFSAGGAGLATLPLAVGSAVGGAISGAVLADRLGRAVLQVGATVEVVGLALIWLLHDQSSFHYWQLLPGLAVVGLGTGLVIAALFNIILGAVEDHEAGTASGVLTSVQSISSSIGIAVFGSVLFSQLRRAQPGAGLDHALYLAAGGLLAFLILTLLLPRTQHRDSDDRAPEGSLGTSDVHPAVDVP